MKNIQKISFFIAFFGVLLVTACSKEKGGVTPNVLRKLDKIAYSDGTFFNYTYDANGRIARVDAKNYYEIFSYAGTAVTFAYVGINGNTTSFTGTYTLNAQGLAANQLNTQGGTNYLYEYEYNAAGYLKRYVAKNKPATGGVFTQSFEVLYTYDNGNNLLSFKSVSSGGSVSKYDYEYDKNRYNTTGKEFNGFDFLGRSSSDFSTKSTYTPSSGAATVTTYAGTFDKKGYLLNRVSTSGSMVITSTYTYK